MNLPDSSLPPLPAVDAYQADRDTVEKLADGRRRIEAELAKVVVGQNEVIEQILIALFAGGHCLITGAPGLGQDPAGAIHGPGVSPEVPAHPVHPRPHARGHHGHRDPARIARAAPAVEFVHGPGVRQHDSGRRNQPHPAQDPGGPAGGHAGAPGHGRRRPHPLEEPFFVLATQNPIEKEGTYPLPEAQLDRFMFNVVIDYLRKTTRSRW